MRKLEIGDQVRFNNRTPKLLFKLGLADRKRSRKVTRIVYDDQLQCSFYYLGDNHKGSAGELSTIGFRSFQLTKVQANETSKRGRPRMKRKYNRKAKLLIPEKTISVMENCDFRPGTVSRPMSHRFDGIPGDFRYGTIVRGERMK